MAALRRDLGGEIGTIGCLKIAVLASFGPSLTKFRGSLLAAMAAAGHEVVATAPDSCSALATELRSLGVAYESIPLNRRGLNPFKDFNYFLKVKGFLERQEADLCLSYTIKPIIFGSFAARAAKTARIFSLVTGLGYTFVTETLPGRILSGISTALYSRALRFNSGVFFQNPDDRKLFVDRGLVGWEKTHVVNGSGVDLDFYHPQTNSQNHHVFLMVARLLRAKGVMEFLSAAEKVKSKFPNADFVLAGDFESGPDAIRKEELDPWIKTGIVRYLGWVDDVRSLFRDCTAYVLPSYREGTPRSVLEAMSSARPIITTDAAGCRDTVIEGYNGFLVPVKNAERIAEAMERFIANPGLSVTMGANSRRLAEEKYDVEKVNLSMLQVMGLLEKRPFAADPPLPIEVNVSS